MPRETPAREPIRIEPDGGTLERFILDRSRVAVIRGPVGSGKTRAVMARLLSQMDEVKPDSRGRKLSRIAVIRDTYANLLNTTVKAWCEMFPEGSASSGGFGHMKRSPPLQYDFQFQSIECEVLFFPLDDDNAVKKLRSLDLTMGWWNEGQYGDLPLVGELNSRLTRYPKKELQGRCSLLIDMNAPPPDHWTAVATGEAPIPARYGLEDIAAIRTIREAMKAEDPAMRWSFFTQPPGLRRRYDARGEVEGYEPNPDAENMRYLDPNYYLNVVIGKTRAWIDANVMNELASVGTGKAIFPEFSRDRHVAGGPLMFNPEVETIIGLDFGLTPAAVVGQRIRGRWIVLREYVFADAGADVFCEEMKRKLRIDFPDMDMATVRWWGDPAGGVRAQSNEVTAFDVFAKRGIRVRPTPGGNRWHARKDAVSRVLTRRTQDGEGILFDPSMTIAIAGMAGGYQYRKITTNGQATYIDEPDKRGEPGQYSHVCEALQYMLGGGGEIDELLLKKKEEQDRGEYKPPPRTAVYTDVRQGNWGTTRRRYRWGAR